jgi:hypothetical protein
MDTSSKALDDLGMSDEEPKRLTPTASVTRDLYLRSGNRCAYPGCYEPLMRADGVLVGEIAHIEAALPTGKRFRREMSNEDRRAFENLLLLCGTHHTVVDTDDKTWTVEALHDLKRTHEGIYTGAVDQLRLQVGDLTEGVTWKPAQNLGRLDLPSDGEELAWNLEVLHAFAERLAVVPRGARSVLAVIVSRGDRLTWSGDNEISIPVPLLNQIVDCSLDELREHLDVLEHMGFAGISEPFEGPFLVVIGGSSPGIGWPILGDLKEMAAGDPATARRVLIDLDFTAFDK